MPSTLSGIPSKWRWHYRALLQVRDDLLRDRHEHAAAVRVSPERGGEDLIDRANEKCEYDTLLAEIHLEDAELAEIDAALERVRTGTYGICELTRRPISAARLRAIPWTRLSRAAASRVAGRLQR